MKVTQFMKNQQIEHVYPYLRVSDAKAAIAFYQEAFGATQGLTMAEPSGRIGHAELQLGAFTVMLSDAYPEYGILAPEIGRPTGSAIHLHVKDVDTMTQKAVDLGATLVMAAQDQFYGERSSKVLDPFGHEWILGQHIEDVSPEEMQRRFEAMFSEEK